MAIEAKLFSRRGAEAQSYKGAEAQTRKVQNLLPFKKNTLKNGHALEKVLPIFNLGTCMSEAMK